MSEAFIRTAYDGVYLAQVTAPSNAGGASAYSQISSLLSAGQIADLAGKVVVGLAMFTSATGGVNYKHGATDGTLGTNSAPMLVLASQKPNEWVPVINAHQKIYLQANSAGGITVDVALYYVNQDAT